MCELRGDFDHEMLMVNADNNNDDDGVQAHHERFLYGW